MIYFRNIIECNNKILHYITKGDSAMDFMDTVKDSDVQGFYPEGWDFSKIDQCCSYQPEEIFDRQDFWHKEFEPVMCNNRTHFDVMMGHEIALEIKTAKDSGRKLAMILPVGPMGMYKWVVYFLKSWNVDCSHVYCFNMDEWSDDEGNTLPENNPAAFKNAMEMAFYTPLEELSVPASQRNFATKANLPQYPEKIRALRSEGAKLVTVFGIGRSFHIAFWEPHFAKDYESQEEWKAAPFRLGAKLHPLTLEQNSFLNFKSRFTQIPCRANTVGPGLFLQSDRIIGGCDGVFPRGMIWQGMSLWVTLRYGPDPWLPSTYMPTMPGRIFFVKELAGPMTAECT